MLITKCLDSFFHFNTIYNRYLWFSRFIVSNRYILIIFHAYFNKLNFITLNTLVINTIQTKWHERHIKWVRFGVRAEAEKTYDKHYCCCLSTTPTKFSSTSPEPSSCWAQQECGFCRYKRSMGLRKKKWFMEGWLPRTEWSQELLNWVLPTTDSPIPNFCCREN